jgi:DNA replication and repair protein RecF
MIITRLEATNFRNIAKDQFEPDARLNLLYGANAQGKTSWLEAIHLLGSGKSFRTSHLGETLTYDQDESIIRAELNHHGLEKQLGLRLTGRSKELYLNGKREPTSRYAGHLTTFVCSLERMTVVRGEPEHRREFLDEGAVSLDPKYARILDGYHRVLKQKNKLLRQASEQSDPKPFIGQIEIWNDQLIEYGTLIHRVRVNYTKKLQAALASHLFGHEVVKIRYSSALEEHGDLDNYAGLLRERLSLRLNAEIAVGYSLVGPHRDDLSITFDGQDVRRFGSSGQQRSALLILDLARISVYNAAFEDYPVFLIDDIDAELDRERIGTLLGHLKDKAQTFITTSKPDIAMGYQACGAAFCVENGSVRQTAEPLDRRQEGGLMVR